MSGLVIEVKAAHLRWLKKAEHWGEWIRFDEVTGEQESVYLMKSTTGAKCRFYAVGKGQVGSDHPAFYHAMLWAYGTGYLPAEAYEDNTRMFRALACRAEVAAGGVSDGPHKAGPEGTWTS